MSTIYINDGPRKGQPTNWGRSQLARNQNARDKYLERGRGPSDKYLERGWGPSDKDYDHDGVMYDESYDKYCWMLEEEERDWRWHLKHNVIPFIFMLGVALLTVYACTTW